MIKRIPHVHLVLLAFIFLDLGCSGGGGSPNVSSSQIPNPLPTLSSVTPNSASAGSGGLTLAVSGNGLVATSVVEWNGAALSTTYISSASLTAQLPASDLTAAGTASIVVKSPSPGGGTSSNLVFTINPASTGLTVVDLEGDDLVWDSVNNKLYLAVPSVSSTNPGTVTIVDPITGSIVGAQQLSSAPSGLALSDDSHYLYAVINGGATIQRLTLPALAPDIQWSLGTDSNSGNPNLAGDIKVQPGAPRTLAVSFGEFGSTSVAIFDDEIERSAIAGSLGDAIGNSLQWKADGTELFAAYTLVNDSPYYTSVSDDALYSIPVNHNGLGAVTTDHSTFRGEGAHLHYEPATGYVYGDWGEVINAESGTPVGNYRYSRPFGTFLPGPLSTLDSSLNRFYTLLEINLPGGSPAFQIQSFDLAHFQLLSTIIIPNAVGEPINLLRWGTAGLAFATTDFTGNTQGRLYILDGSFINPSGNQDASGTSLIPVPTLTGLSPITATVGRGNLTLSIAGHDFTEQSTVYWNGNTLPTTLVNGTLEAQVSAADLAAVGQATITASNSGSANTSSNPLPFSVNPPPSSQNQITVYGAGGNDLVWDASTAKIYVSMPGIQGDSGDTIAIVDPVGGTVTNSSFLGSDPARLSLSDSGQYLYMALYGANAVQQLTLPNLSVNNSWNLGGVGTFNGPYYALDLQVAPGAPQTTAVALANFDVSPSPVGVMVYDGPNPRVNELPVLAYPYSSLQWAGGDTTLYAIDQQTPQDFLVLGVGPSGAVLNQHYDGIVSPYSGTSHYDAATGLIYTDGGQVIRPSDGTVVGSYGASGLAVPDSTSNTVFILGQTAAQTGTSNYTIQSFEQTKFTAIDSITVDNVIGTPTALIRWGTNGLAFTSRIGAPADFFGTGAGQLYVISGTFVSSSAASREPSLRSPLMPVQRTGNLEPSFGPVRYSEVKAKSDSGPRFSPLVQRRRLSEAR